MYLLYCSVLFAVMAVPKRHRVEWAVLAVLTAATWFNKEMLDRNGDALYILRASLTFIAAILLVRTRSTLGFYQAIILLCVLLAYGASAYDVAIGKDVLIYSNFRAWIHGLVACQLIGIFPTVWDIFRDLTSSGRTGGQHLPRRKRT